MHLYLHIPFCKQACHYCDFHFSTNQTFKAELVAAMAHEIALRADYLPARRLETIYFGGGTPSLLTEAELAQLFEAIHQQFTVAPDAEITLEANPDDLVPDKLAMLRRYVNRLSVGIQTFDEATLRWMNRAHTAVEAEQCVRLARDAGFDNLSIDLIYGIPNRPDNLWQADLERALALDVPHLSAYSLTIEPDTAFGRWQQKGRLQPAEDSLAADHFEQLVKALTGAGYDHYEISNFAKPGCYARHNSAYWQRRPYLGVGPAAHSYNGPSRQYNVAHNPRYIAGLGSGQIPAEREELTPADQVNEYLLTGLRTKWGCRIDDLNQMLGRDFLAANRLIIGKLQNNGWLLIDSGVVRLTESGKLFADRVAAELFVD
ncbi:radical SAM family heme chaperone HemW [Nibrella saemangeumensis]|uniref:Heme chaperone HemW n=1 Tax=Nibrella saemangeumensis TaxID=1084526 RepID=A0ABP8MBK6_9BACT